MTIKWRIDKVISIDIINKYIELVNHDLKYEVEDEQQEKMSLYLLHELKSLKRDILNKYKELEKKQ